MFDFSFFALLFLLAQSLAPDGSARLVLENVRHPEQRMEWTRGGDGQWAMTINERDMGRFERRGADVVHHSGVREAEHFPIAALVDVSELRRGAEHVRLAGTFAGRRVEIAPDGDGIVLTDPTRALLRTPLRLRASR
jgi:hypothetical protein